MDFRIEPLPYPKNALEPYVSGLTVEVHYEKHHKGYLEKLAKLVAGKPEENLSLEDLIRTSEGAVFDNAAQVWNHDFYWKSLTPGGGERPEGELRARVQECFGDFASLKERLAEAAIGQFGSGWAWLTADPSLRLSVVATSDADNPLCDGQIPLLTIDVWEHAYYLDHLHQRDRYVQGVVDNLLNWEFAAENLRRATDAGRRAPAKERMPR
jgi:Fe-Mn family superoxide dismutase